MKKNLFLFYPVDLETKRRFRIKHLEIIDKHK